VPYLAVALFLATGPTPGRFATYSLLLRVPGRLPGRSRARNLTIRVMRDSENNDESAG